MGAAEKSRLPGINKFNHSTQRQWGPRGRCSRHPDFFPKSILKARSGVSNPEPEVTWWDTYSGALELRVDHQHSLIKRRNSRWQSRICQPNYAERHRSLGWFQVKSVHWTIIKRFAINFNPETRAFSEIRATIQVWSLSFRKGQGFLVQRRGEVRELSYILIVLIMQ